MDGSFLSTTGDDSLTISDAYYEAVGTRPAMPDFDYSHEYDPAIGKVPISDAYYEAVGTRPAMPDFDYSHEYDPAIGKVPISDAYYEAVGTRPAMPDFDYSQYDPAIGKVPTTIQTEQCRTIDLKIDFHSREIKMQFYFD